MPRDVAWPPGRRRTSADAVEASSRTYNRCRGLLAEACGIEPQAGQGPRLDFEMTVLEVRRKLEGESRGALTEEDFAPSQLLQYMRATALALADGERVGTSRDHFVRAVIRRLREHGGLETRRIHPNAGTGHYAWVESYMPLFLRRHADVASRDGAADLELRPGPPQSGRFPGRTAGRRTSTGLTEPFAWPPRPKLSFYQDGDLWLSSSERDLDLSDTLMLHWPTTRRRVVLGMSSRSTQPEWRSWDEAALGRVERLIRYDLGLDGYRVRVRRLGTPGAPCREEFRWELGITTPGA